MSGPASFGFSSSNSGGKSGGTVKAPRPPQLSHPAVGRARGRDHHAVEPTRWPYPAQYGSPPREYSPSSRRSGSF